MSHHTFNRRTLFKAGAALAASTTLPDAIRRTLAIEPHKRHGTIEDVEHVVILMQENRSFDHYFGCMKGVRGFGDPRTPQQPNGTSIFAQPDENGSHILPFRFNTTHTSSACLASLDHSWKKNQKEWASWNSWISHKSPMTMGHFTREDIPFYYALADAFTLCDAYHCSLFGPTNPNRLFLFTGTSGLAAGNTGKQVTENYDDQNWTADITHDQASFPAFEWQTYAECLQKAGISWKVYQEYDNFGDNPLAHFSPFRNLNPNTWQYKRGRSIVPGSNSENQHTSKGDYLVNAFENDIVNNTLPQVSWIVPSAALSEHPDAPPGYGETLISRFMDIFARHPETFSKTVFILNYDENDGFFDHMPAPIPATKAEEGYSTIPTDGEIYHGEPVGLGPRVPALIISPWTKGGCVNSELFDHTSVLRFLEARFNIPVPNLTPWRRSVCGDLTSAFNFHETDHTWNATLPDTESYLAETRTSCTLPKPTIPENQTLPLQEEGQRPACALPYNFSANYHYEHGKLFHIRNYGHNGIVLRLDTSTGSRHYTLGSAHHLTLPLPTETSWAHIHGPNGFFRGVIGSPNFSTRLKIQKDTATLYITNTHSQPLLISISSAYHALTSRTIVVPTEQTHSSSWDIRGTDHWYDFKIEDIHTPLSSLHFAGHYETGEASRTDPLIGQKS